MPASFDPPFATPNRPALRLMVICGLMAVIASAAALVDGSYLFLATGLWALAIMLIPVVANPRYDLFSMWSFVALTVFVGVTLRGACLTFDFPDAERLDHLFFRGRDPAFFFGPAAWLLAGLFMLALGFVAIRFPERPAKRFPVHHGRALALGLVLLVISTAATWLYISKTGGFAAGEWSAKRTVIPGLDLKGSNYQSFGGLRFLASLALFGHLLVLSIVLAPGPRCNRALLWGLALALLGVACVVPFYASLRTTVALNLCFFAAMIHFSGRRFHRTFLIAVTVVLLLAVYVMTALRPASPDRKTNLAAPTITRVFEAAVINRNQIELPKTAHILHAVPEKLPLQYGKTIVRWLIAPIPRSLWPDKPIIPPGPEIGRTVYGQRVAGVPPSLVAELFWNFHVPGILIGSFGLGMLLRYLQGRFAPVGDLWFASLYVAGPMTLGFEAVGSSIGSGLFRAALHTVVMLGLLLLIRARNR